MKPPINFNKVVVFTGAGVSAESGLDTFRSNGGYWHTYRIQDVASLAGWQTAPETVLEFYNQRKQDILNAQPNFAHEALVKLEQKFEVIVITQNIDNLHERAGSSHVIHLHGEVTKARSSVDDQLVYNIGDELYDLSQTCAKDSILRPSVVWFGEQPENLDLAKHHFQTAARVLVIGTSLEVLPAARLVKYARYHAEKIIVSMELDRKNRPYGFHWLRGKAGSLIPVIVEHWLNGRKAL